MRIAKKIFYTLSALCLVYFIYQIAIIFFKIGFTSMSSEFLFITLGLYMCIPLIKCARYKRQIQIDKIELIQKINKNLKKLNKNNNILHDVTLKTSNGTEDIDNIIMSNKGVFNIVYCDYEGSILIDKDENWNIVTRKKITQIKSQAEKIKKNRNILSSVLKEDQIFDLIVMTKDNVYLEVDNKSSIATISYYELADYINNFEGKSCYDSEDLYEKVYPIIYKTKDINNDKEIYDRFLENKWQYRSRLAFASVSFVLYLLNIINK